MKRTTTDSSTNRTHARRGATILGGTFALIACVSGAAVAQTSTLLSAAMGGGQGNGTSQPNSPQSLSGDGRQAVFVSLADDLVANDTNQSYDVFVYDRLSGALTRVSVDTAGNEASAGGGVSQFNTVGAAISWSGSDVVFPSESTDLVASDTNGYGDIFLRDRDVSGNNILDQAGDVATILVSVDSSGTQADNKSWFPTVSGDGRFVCFVSTATNLVSGDTNGVTDVFVRDVKEGRTVRVSVSSGGAQCNGSSFNAMISADGRWVVFDSQGTNLVTGDTNAADDVFLHDRDVNADGVFDQAGDIATYRISVDSMGAQANGISGFGGISHDGHYVSFSSYASNLVSGDTNGFVDAFVRDTWAGMTTRVSLDSSGNQPNGDVSAGPMSGDGRYVLMSGNATNMYPGDLFNDYQFFLRDRDPDRNGILDEAGKVSTTLASVLPNGNPTQIGPNANSASISASGNAFLFAGYDGFTQQTYLRELDIDTDGDGLFDSWETNGIDFDGDGNIDLTLTNANPQHKDLYVHMDAMAGRLPAANTLAAVVNRFATIPNSFVRNPDGQRGITLHLEIDETNIAVQSFSGTNPWGPPPPAPPPTNTFQWYSQNFNGTAAERASANWANIRGARRLAYRHFLWADSIGASTTSGQGDEPGNEAYASLGNWATSGGTAAQQAGILMHELGHNLGLGHGGTDTINYKPNYPRTVMNYAWTMPTTAYNGWLADYTRLELPFLDESNLNEAAGLGGPTGPGVPAGPPVYRIEPQSGPVDWDRSNFISAGVAADVNYLWASLGASPGQGLCGHTDWANLWYPLAGDSRFFGPSAPAPGMGEMTFEDFENLSGNAPPQLWQESFDEFAAGDGVNLHGLWETWCDYDARDADVDNLMFRSPPNSLRVSFDGTSQYGSDVVARHSTSSSLGMKSGRWTLSVWTHVPGFSTGSAYVIALNQYCDPGHNWSMQVQLDATAGMVVDFDGSMLPMLKDQWVQLRAEIDLDADSYEIYYNDQLLTTGVWTEHVSGTFGDPGVTQLAAINFFDESATEVFFDDISIESVSSPPPTCVADLNGDGATNVLDFGIFADQFGTPVPPGTGADFDADGFVTVLDFGTFVADFGCPSP